MIPATSCEKRSFANRAARGFNARMPPDQPTTTRYTFDRVVRMLLTAGAIYVLFLLVRHLSDVLLPFAAAVVLAYLLNPLVNIFQRRTRRRGPAVVLTIGLLSILVAAVIALLVPLVVSQARRFRTDLEKLRDDLGRPPPIAEAASAPGLPAEAALEVTPAALVEKTATGWRELTEGWTQYRRDADTLSRRERLSRLRATVTGTYIGQLLESAVDYAKSEEFRGLLIEGARRVVAGGWTVLNFGLNLLLGLTALVLVLVYLIFLLVDYPQFSRDWKSFLPPQYREAIVDFLGQFDLAMRQYFRGQAVVAMITGTLYLIGFSIINLPMGVPLGLLIVVLYMVPYLAAVTIVPALLLACLRAIEQDSSFTLSILLTLCVYGVVESLQNTVITPRVMGHTTGLRPVVILLGVFIWGKLLGFLGVLLAIPLTCLGIAYYRRYVLLPARAATKPVVSAT